MEISPPNLLAKLPRSTRPHAATNFTVVCAITEGVKKRRKELCAAIDGDSLSIYEVNTGNILASYAVPPTSLFSGPPLSIREKRGQHILRRTYCCLKRNTLRIESFESVEKEPHSVKAATSSELLHQDSPIVLLDLIQGDSERTTEVLILQQNGSVTILSEDLTQKLSQTAILTHHQSLRILAAQHLSSTEARKTVLSHRSDLISAAALDTTYLTIVYSKSDKGGSFKQVYFAVCAMNPSVRDEQLQLLFEHDLDLKDHEAQLLLAKTRSFSFNPQASHLYLKFGGSLITFDVSGLLPQQTSALHSGFSGSPELMAISPAFAICQDQESLHLFDLKYQTSQAYLDLKRLNLKRKRSRAGTTESQTGAINFVSYFPTLARVIGRRRNQLVAIDLTAKDSLRRALVAGTNLIQNIGQGLATRDIQGPHKFPVAQLTIGTVEQNDTSHTDWQNTRECLDQLAQAGDVAEFEDAFVDGIQKLHVTSSSPLSTVDDLPTTNVPDYKSKYILTKIFQIERNSSIPDQDSMGGKAGLKVQLPSFRLILWLSRRGLLSTRSVQIALTTSSATGAGEFLTAHAVAQALLSADPSLNLLHQCIENGFSNYVEEQVAIVHVLVKHALSSTATGPQDELSKDESTDAIKLADTRVQTVSQDSSTSWISNEIKRALVAALNRLGAAATSPISSSLTKFFTQTEILALVQFLRQQLFQGGHTQSFRSLMIPESDDEGVVNLDGVIRVLSCCIDGIGPLGLIGAMDNEAFIDSIIPDLTSEIASTKKSLEEVTELQGILREMLRYHEFTQKRRNAGSRVVRGRGQETTHRSGTLITLYSEGVDGRDSKSNEAVLPLGTRAENLINPIKVRKGGGQISKRSARQMSMLEQRGKGPYSFERLVL